MSRTSRVTSTVAACTGVMLLLGAGGMAFADDEVGTGEVEITVEVVDLGPPGALTMSVASDSTALTENGSDATARVFTGALPVVTITDTRDAAEIAPGAYWYVLGQVSNFVNADNDVIGAENLGWAPELIDGGELGLVAEGDVVDPELDGGPGLIDQELLAMAVDSGEISPEGSWTATADLTLKTDTDVAAGEYSATLTLSLFE